MKKGRRNCISLAGGVASALALSATSFSASAEVINVPCNTPSLINALNSANSSPEDSVLNLANNCTYTLTTVNNEQEYPTHVPAGPNGLPAVPATSTGGKLVIHGNKSAIKRSTAAGTPAFRIFYVGQDGDVTLSDLTVEGGDATCNGSDAAGGGIQSYSGILTLVNSAVKNNVADYGGGIIAGGQINLQNTSIENNSARVGGGIDAAGTINIAASRIVGNRVTDSLCHAPSVSQVSAAGGGLGGNVTITDSVVANNKAQDNFLENGQLYASNAGGLVVTGSIEISNTTFSGNHAGYEGALNIFLGSAKLNTVTIANNDTYYPWPGGSGLSRGLDDTTVFVKNSIVAGNTTNGKPGNDCDTGRTADSQSHVVSSGNNFDSDGSCTGFTHTTVDALKLGPLANNGGPTETHSLLPGSVAIDAATDCTTVDGKAITTDQRGVIRPQGKACDVGAFERGDELYVVNNLVSFNVVPGTAKLANDLVGCSGFAKKYRFSALLTNTSDTSTPKTLTNLAMQVRKLSGGNKLFLDGSATPGTVYGEGEHTALPLAGGYADGQLAPRENETVTVNVCLTKVAPFQLLVDVLGKTQ